MTDSSKKPTHDEQSGVALQSTTDDLYRLAVENAAIGMCLCTPDGAMFQINTALCATLGRDAAELSQLSWQEVTHPDDISADESLAAQVLNGEIDSYRLLKRYLRPNGDVVWGNLAVSCVRDSDGAVQVFVAQVVDVTELIAARDASRGATTAHEALVSVLTDMIYRGQVPTPNGESASGSADAQPFGVEQLRLVAASATDVVVFADRDRVVRWVSPSLTTNFGWETDQLVGNVLSDLFHPDDWVETEEERARIYASEDAHAVAKFLVRMRTSTDTYKWVSSNASPLVSSSGQVVGVVTSLHNVDDLVTARRAAEDSAARLQALMGSQLDPTALFEAVRDEDGIVTDFRYVDANDAVCKYHQISREELIGARLLEVLPGQAGSGMFELCVQALESNEPLVLDDFQYPHEAPGSSRRYDIRAVQVGNALSFSWREVTDRHRAIEELRASEEQFRLLAENSSDVVVRRRNGVIAWVSPSLKTMLGWQPSDWIGRDGMDFVHPADQESAAAVARLVDAGEDHVVRLRLRANGGTYHWVESHTHPYRDAQGRLDGAVSTFRTVDAEVVSERELRRRAQYDGLTGILSRKEALSRIEGVFGHPPRSGGESAVLFCDVDEFKTINDTRGHAAGDTVLATIAERIASSVRDSDVVGRIGGDEILVMLAGVHSLEQAVSLGEKIRRAVSRPIALPDGGSLTPTVSVGVTLVADDDTVDSAIARADAAMYAAKQSGKDQVVTVDE